MNDIAEAVAAEDLGGQQRVATPPPQSPKGDEVTMASPTTSGRGPVEGGVVAAPSKAGLMRVKPEAPSHPGSPSASDRSMEMEDLLAGGGGESEGDGDHPLDEDERPDAIWADPPVILLQGALGFISLPFFGMFPENIIFLCVNLQNICLPSPDWGEGGAVGTCGWGGRNTPFQSSGTGWIISLHTDPGPNRRLCPCPSVYVFKFGHRDRTLPKRQGGGNLFGSNLICTTRRFSSKAGENSPLL